MGDKEEGQHAAKDLARRVMGGGGVKPIGRALRLRPGARPTMAVIVDQDGKRTLVAKASATMAVAKA